MSFLPYLRQQAALPESERDPPAPEPTAEERAAKHADLSRRIQADIDHHAAHPPAPLTGGVIHFPAAMLDAFGLTEIDE